jgi:Na+/H+ antiporter NhaC
MLHPNGALMRKLGWDLVVVIAFLLFPFRMRVALDRVEKHPGSSTAVGAIALVAMIPIAVLLLVSIIGIPLIPIEIAAVFAGLWIGQGAVALLLGRRLFELMRPTTTPAPLGALVIGLVLITAAETLPVVGWAVTAIVALTGLGAAILAFVRETAFHHFGTRPA